MPAKKRRRSKEERDFLASYDSAEFARPSVAVDIVLLTVIGDKLHALMLQRAEYPDRGMWSLPGGFMQLDESLDDAAQRLLKQKAGLKRIFLEQLFTFGEVDRDPRMRILSVAYYALVPAERLKLEGVPYVQLMQVDVPWEGEKGGEAGICDVQGGALPLAFDHDRILGMAILRLRGKLNYAPIGFELLPREFTLRQLQTIHETILNRPLNKDSFRRRMLASGRVIATGKRESNVGHRPAELYRFSRNPA